MAYWGVAYATGPNYNLPWHLLDHLAMAHFVDLPIDGSTGPPPPRSVGAPSEEEATQAEEEEEGAVAPGRSSPGGEHIIAPRGAGQ